MRKTLVILSALALAACGNTGKKNVEACEDWLAATTCGDYDFSTSVSCSVYEDYDCDVADYFDCLTDNTTCDESTGIPDVTGWADCATLASCE